MAKKHSAIATLWANNVCSGGKTYDEVPRRLKDEVKEILIERGKWVEETPEETETDNNSTDESNTTISDETTKTE